jgi:hypothetical protein
MLRLEETAVSGREVETSVAVMAVLLNCDETE